MAGLATAVGLGGKLESENSGVAEIIRQTGEGISGSIRQGGAGVSAGLKTLDDEKKLRAKDAPKTFETDLMAGEKQRQEYVQAADEMNRKVYDAYNKYVNKEMSRGAYEQLMAKEIGRMMNMKTDMESDYKVLTEELSEIDQDMFDVSEANNALMGKRIVRQKEVRQGEGESAKDQIGSEAEVVPGYFDLPYDQQRKLYKGGLKQLVGKARPIGATFSEAWKDAFGEDNLDAFIEESVVENADGTKRQTFNIKTEDAKNAFNQMMGMRGTNLSPKLNKYFRTLEVQARRVANDMNLSKEQTEFFVETQVERLVAEELQRNFDQSIRNRTKDRKADNNPENEGKGLNITFGAGGGIQAGKMKIEPVEGTPPGLVEQRKEEVNKLRAKAAEQGEIANNSDAGIKEKVAAAKEQIRFQVAADALEKIPSDVESYYVLSSQGNIVDSPLGFSDGKDLIEGKPLYVYPDKDGKWILGITHDIPSAVDGVPDRKGVPKELPMNSHNLGILQTNKDRFSDVWGELNKAISAKKGTQAPATTPSNAPTQTKAPADDTKRLDGSKKGKGYFGELKMKDGSSKIATEITVGVDFGVGETQIPTLVPGLTEDEKNHLLSGKKPTKQIIDKAVSHAEKRMSEGLSPFADGEKLKSKSGKWIYLDLEDKQYKYK